ncbi:hypothetical protein M436DRAFT_53771 [Aureobasidium namibiae CBS 147.97]|uniref:Nucleotide-diphospho-sugar transferase n=1 Tax=Aureobasidium namibiae CBS 147.97 TaxID=1043004 RepID=A0A074WKY1_9PEZI
MVSSTSSTSTVRILSFLLILAITYIIFVPAHPTKTTLLPPTDHDRQASWYETHISTSKPAKDTSVDAESDIVQKETEQQDDSQPPSDIGDHISSNNEAVDDDQLTEEEKAVQADHQAHGQNEPTRDRPKLPGKPDTTKHSTAPSHTSIITELDLPEIRHHTQTNNASAAEHLILVVTHDESHWGHVDGTPRTFPSFLEFLNDTSGLPAPSISLAILTTTESAYGHYVSALSTHPYAKAQVLLYTPTIPEDEGPADRHTASFQAIRRKQIAVARNVLMFTALTTEAHIFYFDSDVIDASPGICAQMLKQASDPNITMSPNITLPETILPVGLITARAQDGGTYDYDLNAWYKQREQHMHDLLPFANSEEMFPLQSVGGTLLYINAVLVRQGLSFPWWYVVGSTWDKEGGDGIETEGICYMAEKLGYGCWGLGGDWHVVHSQ